MLKKIVSTGSSGVDRAARDLAIEMGISHSDQNKKNTPNEGTDNCRVLKLTADSASIKAEQNVIQTDGSLVLSYGDLKGRVALISEFAKRYEKPLLHVDLERISTSGAALKFAIWVEKNTIEILNVAGPRASQAPDIYSVTKTILQSAITLMKPDNVSSGIGGNESHLENEMTPATLPATIDEAVDRLMSEMKLRDKSRIAKMSDDEACMLNISLGQYIRNRFGLWKGNDRLLKACCRYANDDNLHPDSASALIIKALWERLQRTHTIRLVDGPESEGHF